MSPIALVAVAFTNPLLVGGVKSKVKVPLKLPLPFVVTILMPSGNGIVPMT